MRTLKVAPWKRSRAMRKEMAAATEEDVANGNEDGSEEEDQSDGNEEEGEEREEADGGAAAALGGWSDVVAAPQGVDLRGSQLSRNLPTRAARMSPSAAMHRSHEKTRRLVREVAATAVVQPRAARQAKWATEEIARRKAARRKRVTRPKLRHRPTARQQSLGGQPGGAPQ